MKTQNASKSLSDYLSAAHRDLEHIRFEPSELETLLSDALRASREASLPPAVENPPRRGIAAIMGNGAKSARLMGGIMGGIVCASLVMTTLVTIVQIKNPTTEQHPPASNIEFPSAQSDVQQPAEIAQYHNPQPAQGGHSGRYSEHHSQGHLALAGVQMLELSEAELAVLGVELRATDSAFMLRPTRVAEQNVIAWPRYVRFAVRSAVHSANTVYVRWWRLADGLAGKSAKKAPSDNAPEASQVLVSLSLGSADTSSETSNQASSDVQRSTAKKVPELAPVLVSTTDDGTLLPLPRLEHERETGEIDIVRLVPVRVRCDSREIALWYERSAALAALLPERYRALGLPNDAALNQNNGVNREMEIRDVSIAPNPVRDAFTLRFACAAEQRVTVRLCSITGRHIATLAPEARYGTGLHEVSVNMPSVEAGIYVVMLASERGGTAMQRIVVER
jgi:hypothetical protein